MQKLFNKPSWIEVITSFVILLLIFAAFIVTPLITSLPAWPMFFVTIFFFIQGADPKKIASIFLGGAVGILIAFGLVMLLGVIAPSIGVVAATAILVFVALAIIILGGTVLPALLNNVTFAYLTVCAINLESIKSSTVGWLIMLIVGGGILLTTALLLVTSVQSRMMKKPAKQ